MSVAQRGDVHKAARRLGIEGGETRRGRRARIDPRHNSLADQGRSVDIYQLLGGTAVETKTLAAKATNPADSTEAKLTEAVSTTEAIETAAETVETATEAVKAAAKAVEAPAEAAVPKLAKLAKLATTEAAVSELAAETAVSKLTELAELAATKAAVPKLAEVTPTKTAVSELAKLAAAKTELATLAELTELATLAAALAEQAAALIPLVALISRGGDPAVRWTRVRGKASAALRRELRGWPETDQEGQSQAGETCDPTRRVVHERTSRYFR